MGDFNILHSPANIKTSLQNVDKSKSAAKINYLGEKNLEKAVETRVDLKEGYFTEAELKKGSKILDMKLEDMQENLEKNLEAESLR